MSPLGLALAGAGVAGGLALEAPLLGAGLGVAAWAGRVAMAVPRPPRPARMDPFTLNDPWRRFVQKALQARARFDDAVGNARSGPLRDRLAEIGERVHTAVQACWRIANRGQELADARRRIDTRHAERELAELEAGPPSGQGSTDALALALGAQLASASRLDATIADARERLRILDARLDEAAARSVELSVRADDLAALSGLGADVDTLVGDMEALRQGLEEVGGPPAAGG